jgi:hypothetical protein
MNMNRIKAFLGHNGITALCLDLQLPLPFLSLEQQDDVVAATDSPTAEEVANAKTALSDISQCLRKLFIGIRR